MFRRPADGDISFEIGAVEARYVEGSACDRNAQSCHIISCNILRSNELRNVDVTVENVVGQRRWLVFGSKEPNFEILLLDLPKDFLDSLEVGALDLSVANSLIVDWS